MREVSRGERTHMVPDRSGEIAEFEREIQLLRSQMQEQLAIVQRQHQQDLLDAQKPILQILGDQEMERHVNFRRIGNDAEQQSALLKELQTNHEDLWEKDVEVVNRHKQADEQEETRTLEEVFEEDKQHAQIFQQNNYEEYGHLHLCDIVAVRLYTRNFLYSAFNKQMGAMDVAHRPPPEWKSMYNHVLAGTHHLKGAKEGECLFRGQSADDEGCLRGVPPDGDFKADYTTGAIVTWMTFASTSYTENVGRRFANMNPKSRGQGVLFKITNVQENLGVCLSAPRCSPEHPKESLSYFENSEDEILLPAGVSMRVVNRHEVKESVSGGATNGKPVKWIVDLEYLGNNVDEAALRNNSVGQKLRDHLKDSPCPNCGFPERQPTELERRADDMGGSDGKLRCILSWNNADDLDLICTTPNGEKINYSNRVAGGGELDVDENAGESASPNPVENICFSDPPPGRYVFSVKNFSKNMSATTPTPFTVQLNQFGCEPQIKKFADIKQDDIEHEVFEIWHPVLEHAAAMASTYSGSPIQPLSPSVQAATPQLKQPHREPVIDTITWGTPSLEPKPEPEPEPATELHATDW